MENRLHQERRLSTMETYKRKGRAELIAISRELRREWRAKRQGDRHLMIDGAKIPVERLIGIPRATRFMRKLVAEDAISDYMKGKMEANTIKARRARHILAKYALKKSWRVMRSKFQPQSQREENVELAQVRLPSIPNLRRKTAGGPVPARYCPAILPAKSFPKQPSLDKNGIPSYFDLQVYHHSTEEREDAIARNKDYLIQRMASDKWLALEGRPPVNDEAVGRAPPISKSRLIEIAQIATEKNLIKKSRAKTDNSLPPPAVKGRSNSFAWDQHFLADRAKPPMTEKVPELPARTPTLVPSQFSGKKPEYASQRTPASIIRTRPPIPSSFKDSPHVRKVSFSLPEDHSDSKSRKSWKERIRKSKQAGIDRRLINRDSPTPMPSKAWKVSNPATRRERDSSNSHLIPEAIQGPVVPVASRSSQAAQTVGKGKDRQSAAARRAIHAGDERKESDLATGIEAAKIIGNNGNGTLAEDLEALALARVRRSQPVNTNEVVDLGEPISAINIANQAKESPEGIQADQGVGNSEVLASNEALQTLQRRLCTFVHQIAELSDEGEALATFKFKPEPVASIHGMQISHERLEACVESISQGSQRNRFRSLVRQVPAIVHEEAVMSGIDSPQGSSGVTAASKPATVSPELEARLFMRNLQLLEKEAYDNDRHGARIEASPMREDGNKSPDTQRCVLERGRHMQQQPHPQRYLAGPANGDNNTPSPEHRNFTSSAASFRFPSSPLEQDQAAGAAIDPALDCHLDDMEASRLSVRPQAVSAMVEDARQMQKQVFEDCRKAGKDPPKYTLLQLIGKGAFGRVYKGKDMQTAAVVAVKIIDIDESDTINPRLADAYGDFIKEVNALTALSEINARNINNVTEALPVGKSMWMITEYCAGGSVSTLMSPTRPGGLQEKWIIPILREVAEAIRWVHSVKIIHRDIKCGNVLITEKGEVQLCDFGIASMLETKIDKRKTVIGTPNWMAPELFDEQVTYGQDIDIWAFGAMAYEIATGSPPNAGKSLDQIGRILKQSAPRLESDSYSDGLRSLIAYCLEPIPSARPSIEDVEKHHYIFNTTSTHPTSSLTQLVKAYKMWEDHGGSRRSLFIPGGAAGPSESNNDTAIEEWNFSTTVAFEQEVGLSENPQDVFDAYGTGVELDTNFVQSRPNQYKGRRRPPPQSLPVLRYPIEVVFDPNTISNYKDNSAQQYGINQQPSSDLPLRDDSSASIVDTMIDLGGHDPQTGLSSFPDMDTIKAGRRGRDEMIDDYNTASQDFSRPALSDPEPLNNNRRTQDWKFPSMAPPASADPEISRFPTSYETPRPSVTPGSGGRPTLVHHPTEPLGGAFGGLAASTSTTDRMSMNSLIDLDFSVPQPIDYTLRPSTANSDVGSVTSEQTSTRNPFEFERHASRVLPQYDGADDSMEPEIYVTEEASLSLHQRSNNPSRDLSDVSDFSTSDVDGSQRNSESRYFSEASDTDYISMPPPPPRPSGQAQLGQNTLPQPPSAAALSGEASDTEMSSEFHRMIDGLTDQLQIFRHSYEGLKPTTITRRPSQRREQDEATAT